MATKLYFIQDLPNYTPPAWFGGWDQPGNAIGLDGDPGPLQSLDPDKYGIKNGSMLSDGVISTTPFTRGIVQHVSRPLLPQTISGTVNSIYGTRAGNASHDLYTRLHIYVINCTTNAVHGILLDKYEESAVEWATASVPVGRALQAIQPINTVTIPSDGVKYRIVAEWGYKSLATAGTNVKGYVEIGARKGYADILMPDMTVGSLSNATGAWLEFSADLTFEAHPIPNIGPETAVEITTLPFTVTIDPLKKGGTWGVDYLNGGGYWYKLTSPVSKLIGITCFNTDPLDANFVHYYEKTATPGPPLQQSILSLQNLTAKRIHYRSVTVGDREYICIFMNSYSPGNTLTLRIEEAPTSEVKKGDLFISTDDVGYNEYDQSMTGYYGGVWYNPNNDTVRNVSNRFPASELGAALANGRWALAGRTYAPYMRTLYIYEKPPTMIEIGRVVMDGDASGGPGTLTGRAIVSLGTDFNNFYVALAETKSSTLPIVVYKVTEGAVIDTINSWSLPVAPVGIIQGGSLASMGVSRDATIIYYGRTVAGGEVKRHNLTTNTPMSDLAPSLGAGYWPGDIIVLKDNTIVVVWNENDVSSKVIHYSASGTVLRTLDYGATYFRIHHIVHRDIDDSDKIWIWGQKTVEVLNDGSKVGGGDILLTNLKTGLVEKTLFHHYTGHDTGGVGVGPLVNTTEKWIPPSSCPLMIMTGGAIDDGSGGGGGTDPGPSPGPAAPDGIYFINPTKATKHDSYYTAIEKKIPNPTIKTALLGE